jgi:formate-dependent phosphoribosylglycinamide formyltransferase (GAR transformylase)
MIVTGSQQHQRPLVQKAKALGHEVLVTDRRPDAPVLVLADHAVVADATRREDILRVASQFRPHAILGEQTDIAVPAVAFVAERLGLPGIG